MGDSSARFRDNVLSLSFSTPSFMKTILSQNFLHHTLVAVPIPIEGLSRGELRD